MHIIDFEHYNSKSTNQIRL